LKTDVIMGRRLSCKRCL